MKGLIFSAPMMLAWLAGNKTVTRRLIAPQPGEYAYVWSEEKDGINFASPASFSRFRYQPGETVYIKEKWAQDLEGEVFYKADHDIKPSTVERWSSPLFMPERAARSHALIVSVRPEKIREITHEEADREGTENYRPKQWDVPFIKEVRARDGCTLLVGKFAQLWNSLHPGSWDRNDWVWRYELEKMP
ncbi:MAG: hypothetical protein ABIJ35_04625 [Acidobacteriota bacterium]